MMKTKQRVERMQQLMKQVRQSVAFQLDQIEQLKEKQRRLQIEIESLHLSTRQERLGLRGELRDELLQLEWPWRKRCSGTPIQRGARRVEHRHSSRDAERTMR